jgi:hypothetical protein
MKFKATDKNSDGGRHPKNRGLRYEIRLNTRHTYKNHNGATCGSSADLLAVVKEDEIFLSCNGTAKVTIEQLRMLVDIADGLQKNFPGPSSALDKL